MKNFTFTNIRRVAAVLLVALSAPAAAWAQEELNVIELTFAGRGESTSVESVTVTNLTHPEIAPVTLSGTDILCLADEETITPIESVRESRGIAQPILTPNPSMGSDGTLIFDAQSDGPVRIGIYSQSGMLMESAVLNVSKGRNTARIPSQITGIYIICIEGQGVKSSTRWICSGSKSFSGIALGGANQWEDQTLSSSPLKGENSLPLREGRGGSFPLRESQRGSFVYMEFNEGDILRFEGKSGQMRTIMHLSPESSHDVTFDFFRCQDKDGYNYPIVRIGDMLWMLEDLRPLSMSGLIRTSNPNIWKSMDDMAAAEFEVDGRAYYTVFGARMAMPEGWHLPSIDETYAFIKDLQCDTLKVGDFLKNREYEDWPMTLAEGPDTIHLQLMANGYINQDGTLIGDEVTGAWATNNTVRHGCPVSFEISALNATFLPRVTHEKRCAFTVRGCRPAPSFYNEMLEQEFYEKANVSSRRRLPMQKVNENGLLGEYYTYGADRKSIFFDYSFGWEDSRDEKPTCTQRSGIIYKTNEDSGWKADGKQLVPLDVNGAAPLNHLRKVTAQGNADGYENVVYASWSKPFRMYWGARAQFVGEGVVNITVYGDSVHNHAPQVESLTLLDASGNPYLWNMNQVSTDAWRIQPGTNSSFKDGTYLADFNYQYYARAFNLNCIQDETGDGVEEIVMNVGDKIAVFNGVTLRCLREYTYQAGATPEAEGRANLRFDVADVTGDGFEDIVVVAYTGNFQTTVNVFDKGHVDEDPVFTKIISLPSYYCDIKVGTMSYSDVPEIAVLTRGRKSPTDGTIANYGYLHMFRLYYDDNLKLKEQPILVEQQVTCFPNSDAYRGFTGNLNLVFGYFRGHNFKDTDGKIKSYPQDLIVGDGLWRWDETQAKPVYQFQMLGQTKNNWYNVDADAIVAVQTRKDDRESLVFFEDHYFLCGWSYPRNNTKLFERWLDNDGKTVKSNATLCSSLFGWGNEQIIRHMDTTTGSEENAHPVLCKFADRDQAKRFKFISYDVAFSEPRVYAALAAAPYYADLNGSDNASTTWGKSSSDGTGKANSDTWGGSIIMGYEHSYSAPFLSSMNAGVEFTAKVSASGSKATEHEDVTTYSTFYSTTQEHIVVMQAALHDVYTYEIIGATDPDEIGTTFQVSMPRGRYFTHLALDDYVRLMASQKGVAKPQKHLTSTPGQPFTYPENYDYVPGIIRNNDDYPFMKAHDMSGGETLEMLGTGGGIATRSIEIESTTTHTNGVEIGVETELVGTLMGIKAGVGFNYNHTHESSHIIGEGSSVEGSVAGLPSGTDVEKYPRFKWNLVWYYVKDSNGEIYPVVNYIVTR